MIKLTTITLLGLFASSLSLMFTTGYAWGQFQDMPTISTRNHFDVLTGEATAPDSTYSLVDNNGEITGCPPEVVVYVHGVWVGDNSLEKPNEVFNRLKLSLQSNNYQFPLIGYSWDSDTDVSPKGWNIAKQIAAKNGDLLAIFISDYKHQCPQTEIRVVAHSLGSRVVLDALEYLNNGTIQNNGNIRISSIHLLGAAVDNEEVSKNPNDWNDDNPPSTRPSNDPSVMSTYGDAIENQVTSFYNLYNTEDDVLEPDTECLFSLCQPVYYPRYEGDLALGQSGSQPGVTLPNNYRQMDVLDEIYFDADANGDGNCDLTIPSTSGCSIYRAGDNHFGYIGFRANETEIIDDGAVNRIVNDWNAQ